LSVVAPVIGPVEIATSNVEIPAIGVKSRSGS
jgi:hypothetical protein